MPFVDLNDSCQESELTSHRSRSFPTKEMAANKWLGVLDTVGYVRLTFRAKRVFRQ